MRVFARASLSVLLVSAVFTGCVLESASQGEQCLGKTCEGDLVCNRAYEPPRCAPLGKSSDLCAFRSECIETLACIEGPGGTAMCATPIAKGKNCGTTEECASGLVCRGTPLLCQQPAGIGQACLSHADCSLELICVPGNTASKCEPYRKEGESCTWSGQCENNLNCNEAVDGGRCKPPMAEDGLCATAGDCRYDLQCTAGQCKKPREEGDACDQASECRWMSCNQGLQATDGTWGVCKPHQALDQPCGDDVDCEAALTCVPTRRENAGVGTCRQPMTLAKGATCRFVLLSKSQCLPGLECVLLEGGTWYDGPGECRSIVTDGDGRPCTTVPGCDGLGCYYRWGLEPACQPSSTITWKESGEACPASGDFCREGLTCNRGLEPSKCVPALSGAPGDPCGAASDCQVELACNLGLEKCAAPGTAKQGEPCTMSFGYTWGLTCESGLVCQDLLDPPVCVLPGSGTQGAPCIDEDDCLPELLCLGENCAPGAASGEDCDSTHPCGRGLVCNGFKCVAI